MNGKAEGALEVGLMHCCACSQVCWHVGPATFCPAHGGVLTWGASVSVPVPVPAFGYRFLPEHCQHCFCSADSLYQYQTTVKPVQLTHEICCNCGIRRMKKV